MATARSTSGRSLKGRALQWLSQREHSRSELRRKLMRAALAEARAKAASADASGPDTDMGGAASPAPGDAMDSTTDCKEQALTCSVCVDKLLDWLEAHRYLAQERFAESRIHARAARYGNLRIRQELQQHQVALSPEAAESLRDSELARACAVLERKFGASPPVDAAARARQMRFLTGRGFSPEVVRRAMRRNGAEQHATFDG